MEDKFSTTAWSAMLTFLLKMPHGIKVCCFQSLALVHLEFCLTCEAAANRKSRFNAYPGGRGVLPYMGYTGTCRWIEYGFWSLCPEQGI